MIAIVPRARALLCPSTPFQPWLPRPALAILRCLHCAALLGRTTGSALLEHIGRRGMRLGQLPDDTAEPGRCGVLQLGRARRRVRSTSSSRPPPDSKTGLRGIPHLDTRRVLHAYVPVVQQLLATALLAAGASPNAAASCAGFSRLSAAS